MSQFKESDLEAINKAIASGVLTVRFEDTSTTYRSMAELLDARNLIRQELGKVDRSPITVETYRSS